MNGWSANILFTSLFRVSPLSVISNRRPIVEVALLRQRIHSTIGLESSPGEVSETRPAPFVSHTEVNGRDGNTIFTTRLTYRVLLT